MCVLNSKRALNAGAYVSIERKRLSAGAFTFQNTLKVVRVFCEIADHPGLWWHSWAVIVRWNTLIAANLPLDF
jgi:hypothetical protein